MRTNTVLGLLAAMAGGSAAGWSADRLDPGDRLERRFVTMAERHEFEIGLQENDHVHLTIEPQGADLEVALHAPDRELMVSIDDAWTDGREELHWVAASAGTYRVEVRSKRPAMPGRYQIRLSVPRPATREDRERVEALRAVAQGRRLLGGGSADAGRAATAALEGALAHSQAAGDPRGQAVARLLLGHAAVAMAEVTRGVEHYLAALRLWQQVGDRSRQVAALAGAANAHQKVGQLNESRQLAQQALALAVEIGDREGEIQALMSLAVPQQFLGEPSGAIASGERALALSRSLGHRQGEADALSILTAVFQGLNDIQRALDLCHEALVASRALGNRLLEAKNLNNLGLLYNRLGEPARGRRYFEEAISICRQLGAVDGESIILHNIARGYALEGDYERAVSVYERSVELKRARGDRRGEARTLAFLGSALLRHGDLSQARSVLESALAIREANDQEMEGTALLNLAEIAVAGGELDKARDLSQRSMALLRGPQPVYQLAMIEKAGGALAEAETLGAQALDLLESDRVSVASASLRASFLASGRDMYDFYVDTLMARHAADPAAGFDARALRAAERARARSLLELLAESRADVQEGVPPDLRDRARALRDRLSGLGTRSVGPGGQGPEARAAIERETEALTRDLEQLEAEIRTRSPRYAALTQPQPIAPADLQALLDEDTLLLEYALGKERSYAWLVGPRSLISVVLPPRETIEATARRALGVLGSEQTDAERVIGELSRLVLSPLAERLTSRRLVVVADGALHYIPFGALPHPRTGELLVVRHEVISLPSASTLALLRQDRPARPAVGRAVAVVADPVFDPGDERLSKRRPRTTAVPKVDRPGGRLTRATEAAGFSGPIPRLPFTRREAQAILSAAPARSFLAALDFEASRATVMDPKLAEYRVVHFATHGFFNASRPELSGLLLSLYDRQGRPQPGFLSAADVFNLKLAADLVVLSGCRTALGKDVQGEGLVGLTRGFMYAGAGQVMASLWPVDDAATAALMAQFYARLFGPEALSPAAALRAAQLDLMKQPRFGHPFFWAAFQLQGDWK
jgi:CHAT domain-containing protein